MELGCFGQVQLKPDPFCFIAFGDLLFRSRTKGLNGVKHIHKLR